MAQPGGEPQVPGLFSITEEDLTSSAPSVRALLVGRLEQMWQAVGVHLQRDEAGDPIDPRMLEIGLRIVREEATLYRLMKPPASTGQDEDEEIPILDRRAAVGDKLTAIEAKLAEARRKAEG